MIAVLARLALILAASVGFSAWGVMLLVGIVHLDWWSAIPTMSYGTAFTLSAVLCAFGFIPALVNSLSGD